MKKYYVKQCFNSLIILLLFCSVVNAQEADSTHRPPNSDLIIEAMNFKDTDLRDILRSLAQEYKTNVMVDNKISKRTSAALFNISVFDAIKIIAKDNNLTFDFDETRFFVKMLQKKGKAKPAESEPVVKYYSETNEADIELKNSALKIFVEKLREETGKNYLLTPGTKGFLTGSLNKMDLGKALSNLLHNNGFNIWERDSIQYISRSSYYSSLDQQDDKVKGHYWVSAKNGRVTVDVKNISLDKIVDDITNQLDLQMIKLAVPENEITVKCSNVPLDKALYYLFKGTDFTFKKDQQTYIIGKNDAKNLDNIKLVKFNHLRADRVLEKIPGILLNDLVAEVSAEHNALVLIGPIEPLNQMEDYLSQIDRPVPQVMIEALVVDYNLDNLYEFGLEASRGDTTAGVSGSWFPGIDISASGSSLNNALQGAGSISMFGGSFNLAKLGNLPADFMMNLKAMERDGIANVKSRPILSALNGHTASLKVGTTQHYIFKELLPMQSLQSTNVLEKETIQKIEAFISFEITPWVGSNGQLTLEIKPDFQTPKGEFSPNKLLIPAINTRKLESTVKLMDGETIVLGGLIQEIKDHTITKTPILGDIPLLGELFKSRSEKTTKSELIIYITPHVFYENEYGYASYEYADDEEEE